jgi:hypothetical protein
LFLGLKRFCLGLLHGQVNVPACVVHPPDAAHAAFDGVRFNTVGIEQSPAFGNDDRLSLISCRLIIRNCGVIIHRGIVIQSSIVYCRSVYGCVIIIDSCVV